MKIFGKDWTNETPGRTKQSLLGVVPSLCKRAGLNFVCFSAIVCHLFMYSRKLSPRDCVTKLRDNRIFKALL